MSFFAADSLSCLDEIQSFGCVSCAATAWLPVCRNSADLAVVPDPNQKENRKKKESKDMADIETQRTQKRFPCMSQCPAFGINFTSLSFTHSSLANQDSEETLNRALHGA